MPSQNSVPCGCRTEVHVCFLAVRRGHYLLLKAASLFSSHPEGYNESFLDFESLLSYTHVMYDLAILARKLGFPGGTVAKNPPANAGDCFKPWEDPLE